MKYSESELFAFMDECDRGKQVKVVCTDGDEIAGRCWAYSALQNEDESGIAEPSLDVGPGTIIYASEIERVDVL